MKMTPEVKEVLSKTSPFSLATASKDGTPNVVPIGMLKAVDDETIWVINNFMNKTLQNLKENPKAAIYVCSRDFPNSYQIKCSVTLEDSGKDYEEAVNFAHSIMQAVPAKTLVKMKVEEIYYTTPGPNAGKKI